MDGSSAPGSDGFTEDFFFTIEKLLNHMSIERSRNSLFFEALSLA